MHKTNRTTLLKLIKTGIPAVFFILLLMPASFTHGQTKSNLEQFYGLIDSASAALKAKIPTRTKEIRLEFILGKTYNVFENRVSESLYSGGVKLAPRRQFYSSAVKRFRYPVLEYIVSFTKNEL